MPYASQQDIQDRIGLDLLTVIADRDRDQVLDAAAIARALDDATSEIDGYLSERYALPLPTAPSWAVRVAVNLAVYRLALTADALTTEIKDRYEMEVEFLQRVGTGKAGLGLPKVNEPTTTEGGEVRGNDILVQSGERLFTRRSTRGF